MIVIMGLQQLTSWKEIASYLGRSVRTAQRWERELELPIKRRRVRRRDMVSASVADLDCWMQTASAVRPEAIDSPVLNGRVLITDLLWGRHHHMTLGVRGAHLGASNTQVIRYGRTTQLLCQEFLIQRLS
jgi:hypothetical protein